MAVSILPSNLVAQDCPACATASDLSVDRPVLTELGNYFKLVNQPFEVKSINYLDEGGYFWFGRSSTVSTNTIEASYSDSDFVSNHFLETVIGGKSIVSVDYLGIDEWIILYGDGTHFHEGLAVMNADIASQISAGKAVLHFAIKPRTTDYILKLNDGTYSYSGAIPQSHRDFIESLSNVKRFSLSDDGHLVAILDGGEFRVSDENNLNSFRSSFLSQLRVELMSNSLSIDCLFLAPEGGVIACSTDTVGGNIKAFYLHPFTGASNVRGISMESNTVSIGVTQFENRTYQLKRNYDLANGAWHSIGSSSLELNSKAKVHSTPKDSTNAFYRFEITE